MPEVNGRWVADMKAPRTPDNEEPAAERAHDFRPVDKGFTEEMAVAEAARCMRCKKPLCVQGCPVNINIPAFIEKIAERDFGAGLDIIRESSMLPAICGRVCPQETQCEGKCIRGVKSEPVAIGQLERFLGDQPELASEPEKGERCRRCYKFRLQRAYDYAAANNFDYFCSSLSISLLIAGRRALASCVGSTPRLVLMRRGNPTSSSTAFIICVRYDCV